MKPELAIDRFCHVTVTVGAFFSTHRHVAWWGNFELTDFSQTNARNFVDFFLISCC